MCTCVHISATKWRSVGYLSNALWDLWDGSIATTPLHDDVIKWKHVPRYWPFAPGIHRSPVNSPHKGQWRGSLMFSLICAWINGWANNREAGDLRRHRAHHGVTVMRHVSTIAVVNLLKCVQSVSYTSWIATTEGARKKSNWTEGPYKQNFYRLTFIPTLVVSLSIQQEVTLE